MATSLQIDEGLSSGLGLTTNMGKQARVLHILEATLGGTMRYLENVLDASLNSKLNVGFAYAAMRADHRLQPMLERARQVGWQLFPIDMCREISPLRDASCLIELVRTLHQFRPDILHCHSSKAGALGRLASIFIRPRPRIVYSPHALSAGNRVHLWIEQALKGLTHAFVAVSDSERQQILSYGLANPNRIDIVYPAVDIEYFRPMPQQDARRRLHLPQGPMIVGVGRLTAQKNPIRFLQILGKVKEQVPDAFAVWVGDGELRDEFVRERSRLDLAESVYLTGWEPDVRPYLAASDVLLSTSEFESFGYMVAESLAMSRPVVASRVCGTIDILRDDLGTNLFETTAQAAFLLTRLLRDGELAAQFGRAGRMAVEKRFTTEQMRLKLPAYYQSLLTDASRA